MIDRFEPGKSNIHVPRNAESSTVNGWNAVISRIAIHGLKSAAQLQAEGAQFFPSDDEFPRDRVCGISIHPFPSDDRSSFEYFLRRLYSDCESVIPVILESPGEKRGHYDSVRAVPDDVIRQECERRAAASFLVVCRKDPWLKYKGIPSEEFDYVLFPSAVYKGYIQDTSAPPFPLSVQVRAINDMVKRVIEGEGGIDMELEIPNYERALLEVVGTESESLFIHGVRLPLTDKVKLFKKDPSLRRL